MFQRQLSNVSNLRSLESFIYGDLLLVAHRRRSFTMHTQLLRRERQLHELVYVVITQQYLSSGLQESPRLSCSLLACSNCRPSIKLSLSSLEPVLHLSSSSWELRSEFAARERRRGWFRGLFNGLSDFSNLSASVLARVSACFIQTSRDFSQISLICSYRSMSQSLEQFKYHFIRLINKVQEL